MTKFVHHPKKINRRVKEDPQQVYERQVKYLKTIEILTIKPLKKTTKERYLNLKGSMTHEEFLNVLLDKFEG